ncbi:MAG: transcription termination/antitermination protein NusG [Lachnospiraceae bacterium]|jgi:transcriptional antiterminator NusG
MEEAKWYVVHTFSGYENTVKQDLENTIKNHSLQDVIQDVIIPLEEVHETTADGKEKVTKRKIFPAYVLVKMVMNNDTWYIVRNTRGVTGFVGPGSEAVPLTDEEMEKLQSFMGGDIEAPVPFRAGDFVTVTGGPWEGTSGRISSVDADRKSLTIFADVFGKQTPVELDFKDVKKA